MKQTKQFIHILALFICSFSIAQTGQVAGTVMDGDFNEPLAFANILVKGTTTGTTSDFDGKYVLDLDAGTYTLVFSFVGYDTQEISEVTIKAGSVETIDVTMTTNALEAVVVTTTVKRNTENAVLNIQKKSATLLDGLSAQSIKKSGAGDIAAAVKSVPGVSVEGGKYVYVRGLGDRYSKSILNGVDIPGLDPDRNTIQMDIFPTNLIDNLIVVKSAAAEYPADFTGGVVNIVTKDFPTKAEYSISLGAGYNPDMHFNENYLTYKGSNSDFLGFDNGKRNLPINRYQPIPGTFDNNILLTSLTNQFEKQLKADKENSGLNYDFGITAGNQFEVGENDKLGYQVSLSYKNNTTFYENRVDGLYIKKPEANDYELAATRLSKGEEGVNNVLLSGLVGLTYKTQKSKYKLNLLHIQNGESTANFISQGVSQDNQGGAFETVVKDGLLYTERSISNLLLSGEHRLNDNLNFSWKFSPTLSKANDKDHRITPLEITQDGDYVISPSTSSFPLRLWRNLQEENWVGKADLENKYTLFSRPAKLKFGGGYTYKYRDFSIDQISFTNNLPGLIVENGDTNTILLTENLWTPDNDSGTYITFETKFQPVNSYEGEATISSAYVSNEFNISEELKAIAGLRLEQYTLFYTGQNQNEEVFSREKIIEETDLFPSLNLIYALNEDSNLRTSYYKTTARPSFKEASIAQIFDPILNQTFIGNAFGITDASGSFIYEAIKPSYINNFDLRYEWFREKGQMIALSGFYKDFKDPIEKTFFPSTAEQLTVANLGNAQVYGAEVEFRQALGFISNTFENVRFNLNASIINSELEMSEAEFERRNLAAREGETIKRKRDLQGQSPFLINAGLDYNKQDSGFRTGLFYNVQGKSLEVVGTGIIPDVYTKPFHSLNLTANYSFGEKKNSTIDLKISNILGSERQSVYESFKAEDQVFKLRQPGREFSLGYTYKF